MLVFLVDLSVKVRWVVGGSTHNAPGVVQIL